VNRMRKAVWRAAEWVQRKAGSDYLFVPPGHFYSPVCHLPEARRHFDRIAGSAAEPTLPGIPLEPDRLRAEWRTLAPFLRGSTLAERPTDGARYSTDVVRFPAADGLLLHAMMRAHRPRRIIEIGSGWSSACMLDTIDRHLAGECELTFIEPNPEVLLARLKPEDRRWPILRHGVQETPLELFGTLEAGDFLFIDSTHVAKTGSDVCFEIFEILPRLAPGVFVHFHDMFWPFDYPRHWVLENNQSWNEAYVLRAFLTDNPHWEIVAFNDWFRRFERPRIEAEAPGLLRRDGGSLWLRKRSA